jgi:hypothetical protein
MGLKREGETDEEATERVRNSRYIVDFKHDEYWPFYEAKEQFGKIILTINTAHPFFSELYEPVRKINAPQAGDDADEANLTAADETGPVVALDLLLLSLARTQSRLSGANEDARRLRHGQQ